MTEGARENLYTRFYRLMGCLLVFGGSMMTENVLTMIGGVYIFFVLTALIQLEQREQDSLPPVRP